MTKPIALIDLEGVLFPEMWPAIAEAVGDDRLAITTREVPNYETLMLQRLNILRSCSLSLAEAAEMVRNLSHLRGAHQFINHLRSFCEVTIVTDSFAPMNERALSDIASDRAFTNHLGVDREGYATECFYWHIGQGKERVFEFLPAGRKTFAIGDGFNDLGMLRKADFAVLYRPSEKTRLAGRDLNVLPELERVIEYFEECWYQLSSESPGGLPNP